MISEDKYVGALPTTWNGYRFRSRLESRWAVFLTNLGIDFNYEPEGFKLPSGDCYLPDFFLPQVSMWAEVKPLRFTPVEKRKCKELADITGHPCLLLFGPPDFTTYPAVHSLDLEEGSEVSGRYECDYLLDIHAHRRAYYDDEHRFFSCEKGEYTGSVNFTPAYREAVHLARAERFDGRAA